MSVHMEVVKGSGGGGGGGLVWGWNGVQSPSPSQHLSLCMQYMALFSPSRPSQYILSYILGQLPLRNWQDTFVTEYRLAIDNVLSAFLLIIAISCTQATNFHDHP